MESSFRSSKRAYESDLPEGNGKKKFRSSGGSRAPPPLRVGADEAVFRILCVAPKIGGVIGKEGSIVKQIRADTGAKVRVEEGVLGCEERVIVIVAPVSGKKDLKPEKAEKDEKAEESSVEAVNAEADGNKSEDKDEDKKDETEKTGEGAEEETEKKESKESSLSPAQEALLRVQERILEGELESKPEDEGAKPTSTTIVTRLLVPTWQVGCVLGKGGKVIQEIRTETGTQIRILSKEQVPPCALPSDEVVQITGDAAAVKKALLAITDRLLKNPPRESQRVLGRPPSQFSHPSPFPSLDGFPSRKNHSVIPPVDYPSKAGSMALMHDAPPSLGSRAPVKEEIQFRLLCTNDKVGSILGRGGVIIKGLQRDTGADIKIAEAVPEEDERIVVITGNLSPESRISPAQDALLRVYNRIATTFTEQELKEKGAVARLLVPANQVGCLLGKGGTIISEMRKLTRADIRIFGKDNCPKCANPDDELVKVTGDHEAVQDALVQISGRLQNNLYPEKSVPVARPGFYADPLPPVSASVPPYRGRPEPVSPPRMYSRLGTSIPDIEPSARLPLNIDRPSYAPNLQRPVDLTHKIEKPSSPGTWGMQGITGTAGRSMPDYGRGFPTRTGLKSASQSAVVTNTTVEVHVPEHIIGSIYGENGSNLNQIRQISGAKVIVHDPRPGMSEAMVLISGTPEQTKAAQSLLQAFIISGQSSP